MALTRMRGNDDFFPAELKACPDEKATAERLARRNQA
jgi:hypothetical protein